MEGAGGSLAVWSWETPASRIFPACSGNITIIKKTVKKGMNMRMDGVLGYDEYLAAADFIITVIYEGDDPDNIWMSDSPFEYYSMWELVAKTKPGRVLVGGLGLGILANLLANREDITEVVVVERSDDVIRLIRPYLNRKVRLVHDDFLQAMRKLSVAGEKFDTVISDIYATCGESDRELFEDVRMNMEDWFMSAKHLHWCFEDEIDDENIKAAIVAISHDPEASARIRQF